MIILNNEEKTYNNKKSLIFFILSLIKHLKMFQKVSQNFAEFVPENIPESPRMAPKIWHVWRDFNIGRLFQYWPTFSILANFFQYWPSLHSRIVWAENPVLSQYYYS